LRLQRFNKGKAISAAKSNNVYAGALWKPDAQLILEQNRRQLQNKIRNWKTISNLVGKKITAIKSHDQQSWLLQHGQEHSYCVWLIEDLLNVEEQPARQQCSM